jgi:hypothetical protein
MQILLVQPNFLRYWHKDKTDLWFQKNSFVNFSDNRAAIAVTRVEMKTNIIAPLLHCSADINHSTKTFDQKTFIAHKLQFNKNATIYSVAVTQLLLLVLGLQVWHPRIHLWYRIICRTQGSQVMPSFRSAICACMPQGSSAPGGNYGAVNIQLNSIPIAMWLSSTGN